MNQMTEITALSFKHLNALAYHLSAFEHYPFLINKNYTFLGIMQKLRIAKTQLSRSRPVYNSYVFFH